jgi:hypothetical protein
MATPNDILRRVNDTNRTKNLATWIMAAVFFAALLGVLFVYNGQKDATSSSGSNPPNVVYQSQPNK